MDLTLFIERLISLFYFFMGLSLIFRPTMWAEIVDDLVRTNTKMMTYLMVCFALPLGLGVILLHNVWVWSPVVLITLFGWGAVTKSVLHLLFPGILNRFMPAKEKLRKWMIVDGVIVALLYGWVVVHVFFCDCQG